MLIGQQLLHFQKMFSEDGEGGISPGRAEKRDPVNCCKAWVQKKKVSWQAGQTVLTETGI